MMKITNNLDLQKKSIELQERIMEQKQRRDKTFTLLQDIQRQISLPSGKHNSYLKKNKETLSSLLQEETSTLQRMQKELYLLSQKSTVRKRDEISETTRRYGLGIFVVLVLVVFGVAFFRFIVMNEQGITGAASLDILAPPTSDAPILNSTDPTKNDTTQNLTVYPQNVADADGDAVKNITNWILNRSSIMRLNLPFEGLNSSVTNASDYSGNQNNFTLNGNVAWALTGGYDARGAYVLDGADAYLNRSYDPDFDFGNGSFTIVGWFKVAGAYAPGSTITRQVAASGDDAEEPEEGGTPSISSADLELTADTGTKQRVGVRFLNVTIPKDAVIVNATLNFTSDVSRSGAALILTFMGEYTNDAAIFTTGNRNLVDRPNTTNRINWTNIPDWTAPNNYSSPSLSPIVQEIVRHPEWKSGNSLAIFVHSNSSTVLRSAESFNGNVNLSPRLTVTYRQEQYLLSRYDDTGFKLWLAANGSVVAGFDDDSLWNPEIIIRSNSSYNDSAWHFFSLVKRNNTNISLYIDGTLTGWNDSINAVENSDIYNITQSSDDAEQNIVTLAMDLTSTDLDLVTDTHVNYTTGLRYQNVMIPLNATVTNSYLVFRVDERNVTPANLTFSGEAADNATNFTTRDGNITNRTKTATSVDWIDIPNWGPIGFTGSNTTTPNISTIITEIINRSGWIRGNSLVIMVNTSNNSREITRVAESFDKSNAVPAYLVVNYTAPLQTLTSDSASLLLGSNFPTGFYFNGTLDEFRLFNRSLTPEQIAALYNNKTNLIVSQELAVGDNWTADVTPNDNTADGTTRRSNSVIVLAPPAGDTTKPAVTALIPALSSTFNTSTTIEIAANVTDNTAVDTVYANLTAPNGTIQQISLSSAGGAKYNNSFEIKQRAGVYNLTFYANDSSNNINASEKSNFTANLICGQVIENSTMTQNLTAAGGCFTINLSQINLNCAGYRINYSISSSFVRAIDNSGFANVTIKNCVIYDGADSVTDKQAIRFTSNAVNGSIYNNTIYTNGTRSTGIFVQTSNGTNVSSNTVTVSGPSGSAIDVSGANNITVYLNTLTTTGEGSEGLRIGSLAACTGNYFWDNLINSSRADGIEISTSSTGNLLNNNTIYSSQNFSINDKTNDATNNSLVYNNSLGMINWTKVNLTTKINLTIGETVFLANNVVGLVNDSNALKLNSSAKIEIRNLSYASTPFLLKDGVRCDNDPALCNITSYNSTSGILFANISSFSNYTTQSSNTAPPAPVLLTPVSGNTTVNRTPTFVWNNSVDAEGDNVTYNLVIDDSSSFNNPEVNVSGIANTTNKNTTYTISTILNVDTTYFWQVRGNDGTVNGSFSSSRNFTVESFLALSIVRSTVEFGSVNPGTNVTTVSDAPPFRAENTGNIFINVSLNATRYFTQGSYPSQSYQFRIEENETGSFNTTLSNTTYINMSATNSTANVVNLDWQDIRDEFLVGLRLNVSTDEPPGLKSSTVTFTASS